MKRGRSFRYAAAAAAGALLVAGCLVQETAEEAPPSAPQAKRGGTITVGITPTGAIEPTFASSPSGLLVGSTLCDTLVHLDPATGEVKPGLAKSWTLSDEGATITFKLRKGLRFHGTEEALTANDVVFSLTRLADPAEGSYLAGLIQQVVGWEEFRAKKDRATRLVGVQVIDRHAVQVRLTSGDADAVRMFAHPATAPVSAVAVEANPVVFARNPVCVGPYQLATPVDATATQLNLVRDPHYFAGAVAYSGGGAGYADKIVFQVYRDPGAAYQAWRGGNVDVVWLPTANVGDATRQFGSELVQAASPQVEYVGVPATVAEGSALTGFDQPEVRRALSLALDRQRIATAVYAGARTPATGFVPPSAAAGETHACTATVPARPDVAAAKQLLQQAGVTLAGRTVPFYYNDEFGHARLVREIGAQWRAAFGLTVKPQPLSWDNLLDKAGQGTGVGGLFRVSWAVDSLSREGYLRPLVSDVGNGPNLARFSKPAADRTLFELASAEEGDRLLALRKLEDIVCAQLPAIPVVFGASTWLVRSATVVPARDSAADPSGRLVLRELYVRAAKGA